MRFSNREDEIILKWNRSFLLCSVITLSLDPLFLYIPVIKGTLKCLDVDRDLEIVVCILRSFADILYVVHIIIQFRTSHVRRDNRIFSSGIIRDPHSMEKHYLKSYFIIDVLAALPLPQLAIFVIIPNLDGPTSYLRFHLLKIIIFSQYVPRVIQAYFFYKKVTKVSGFLIEKAWAGAAFNFFLYVLSSHVIGALWYFFAIDSELRCWRIACQRHKCHSKYLYCGEGRVGDYGFLNTSCPLLERNEIKDSTNFDFGMFLDALHTRVVETRDFREKILYCSWWGLQNLSSLGQGLKTSTFYWEILFADFIAVIGLVLFALLISNMQKYLQSYSNQTLRMEEMTEKRREAEDLMSYMFLPEHLRERVRRHKHYKWKTTRGVELDSFIKDLPWDLRMDIKRHLCLPLLKRVPIFEDMDVHLLDAMCDRLKPVLYTENSYVVREGDPVREMLFITRGEVLSKTTDGGRTDFINSSDLKAGDFCGEELLTWALDHKSSKQLPFSTRTVKTLTDVQAFALVADELSFVANQFRLLHSRKVIYTFRFYSEQWRTWAACFIQAAWRRHNRRKLEKTPEVENKIQHDALVTDNKASILSLGASIHASRFSFGVLRILRPNRVSTEPMMPQPLLLDYGSNMQIKT